MPKALYAVDVYKRQAWSGSDVSHYHVHCRVCGADWERRCAAHLDLAGKRRQKNGGKHNGQLFCGARRCRGGIDLSLIHICVIGSHEFYMGYAVAKRTLLTLDVGHFHPTESIANKITGVIDFVPGILLHLSRPVRWDSDHVVILDDELELIMQEIKRHDLFHKLYIGLDFFDASINRIAAWMSGARNARKALLMAMLEPTKLLMDAEHSGDYTSRLAILEDIKTLPWGAVWEEYCARNNMQGGWKWLDQVKDYEKTVLAQR